MLWRGTHGALQQRVGATRVTLTRQDDSLLDDQQRIVWRAFECGLQGGASSRDIPDCQPRQRLQKVKTSRGGSCRESLFGDAVTLAGQSENRQRTTAQIPPFFRSTRTFPHRVQRRECVSGKVAQQRAAGLFQTDFQRDSWCARTRRDGIERSK